MSKIARILRILTICFLLLASLAGCGKSNEIPLYKLYRVFNVEIGDTLPIALVLFNSNNEPLRNYCFKYTAGKADTFKSCTDEVGYVLLKVHKKAKTIDLDVPDSINVHLPMSASIISIFGGKTTLIIGDSLNRIAENDIIVFYNEKNRSFAQKLLNILKDEKKFIFEMTGLKPTPWVVIVDEFSSDKNRLALCDYFINLAFDSITLKNEYLGTNLHEWTEGTITDRLDLYGLKGKNNRWIGDGITQYIVFEWAKREYPEHFYYDLNYIVNELICDDGKTYDLFKWKEASIKSIKKESKRLRKEKHASLEEKGYWYTPYFWAKIIDKSGNKNLIKEFLSELGKRKVRTADSAVALLSRMTGLDIRKELIVSSKEINQNIRKYWPIPEIPEGMTFVSCGWSFKMGDSTSKHTSPVHEVYVSPFYIDKHEVSNEQFCKFLNEVGNKKEGGTYWFDEEKNKQIKKVNGKYVPVKGYERHPVTYVTWFGARAYCEWAGKRLPTEAEWELAAGGGFTNYKYPWGEDWCPKCCNWKDDGKVDGYKETAPVDAFEKGRSPFGCYNMAGNVFEWVNDWYGDYPDTSQVDPKGPKSGTHKVQRGGCYKYPPSWMTIHARIAAEPQIAFPCVGFRCAKDFVWNPDSIKASAR